MPVRTRQTTPTSAGPTPSAAAGRAPGVGQLRGNTFAAEQLARTGPEPTTAVAPTTGAPTTGAAGGDRAAGTAETTRAPDTTAPPVLASPAPAQEGEQRRTVLGVEIVGRDVSPTALDSVARFVTETLSRREDVQRRLRREKVVIVVIPRGRKMTDVPEFARLRGTQTFDGRLWDDVRGSGGMRVSGGRWAVAVPEENLVGAGSDTYGEGYDVGMHEFAHTIQSKGLSRTERERVEELYEARKDANGPWTEAYGASNSVEYFAQATNCFFGRNAGVGNNGADWLLANDPEMYALLVSIYGPPPRREGARAAGAAPAPGGTPGAAPAGPRA